MSPSNRYHKSSSPSGLQLETILVYKIDFSKKNTQNKRVLKEKILFLKPAKVKKKT